MNAFAGSLGQHWWDSVQVDETGAQTCGPEDEWAKGFAAQQILSLVQRLFLGQREVPVRHVGFCGVENVAGCSEMLQEVARTLSLQAQGDICVLQTEPLAGIPEYGRTDDDSDSIMGDSFSLRQSSRQIFQRVWLLEAGGRRRAGGAQQLMANLRREFDYSLQELPPPGRSAEAALMGGHLDGVVLVLRAQRTRRVIAQQAKELLSVANARLLGVVLTERTFPVPESIYRRV